MGLTVGAVDDRIRSLHYSRFHAPPPAPELVDEALALGDPTLEYRAYAVNAGAYYFIGDFDSAARCGEAALALLHSNPAVGESDAPPRRTHLFNRLQLVARERGALIDAYRYAAEAVLALDPSNPDENEAVLLSELFTCEMGLGVLGRATEYHAALGWRTSERSASSRLVELNSSRLFANGDMHPTSTQVRDWLDDPTIAESIRWQLAVAACWFGVDHDQRDLTMAARAYLDEYAVPLGTNLSASMSADLRVIDAESAFAAGDTIAALAHTATHGDVGRVHTRARRQLVLAAIALQRGSSALALAHLNALDRLYDVVQSDLRPRRDAIREAALEQAGAYDELAIHLIDAERHAIRHSSPQAARDALGPDLADALDATFDDVHQRGLGMLRWERSEVVDVISHDLVGALSVVGIALDLLPVAPREVAAILTAASQRMRSIVDAFSLLVGIEQSKLEPELRPHLVAALVARVVDNQRPAAIAKHISLEFIHDAADHDDHDNDHDDDPGAGGGDGMGDARIAVDAAFFEMSLANVIGNAIKYSPSGRRVEISLAWIGNGRRVAIHVTDEGPGMTALEARSVFGRHVRGNAVATGAEPSLGLGLYICRAMCEMMHAQVWAESAGVGLGSRFSLVFPVLHESFDR